MSTDGRKNYLGHTRRQEPIKLEFLEEALVA